MTGRKRLRIRVEGIVQGVGFRPFVHALAVRHGLGGFVGNNTEGVFIEVEGLPAHLHRFVEALDREAPPLAVIERVAKEEVAPTGETGFRIVESEVRGERQTLISPDTATCEDCLREIFDPADRRYRYPFTNCTNCGPRFTIIRDVPYDRPRTTMAGFRMCEACARVSRPGGPPVPRAADLLPRVWATPVAAGPGVASASWRSRRADRRAAARRPGGGGEGPRRLPSRRACGPRASGSRPAGPQVSRGQALRAHGPRPRRCTAPVSDRGARRAAPGEPAAAHRAAAEVARRAGRPGRGSGQPRPRRDAPLQPPPPPPRGRSRRALRAHERQRLRRVDRLPR